MACEVTVDDGVLSGGYNQDGPLSPHQSMISAGDIMTYFQTISLAWWIEVVDNNPSNLGES